MRETYIFKEVINKNELAHCFRFRYEIHSVSRNKHVLKESQVSVDFDIFDTHSKHYAMLESELLIGYIRIVMPRQEYINHTAIELGKEWNLIHNEACELTNENVPFPFLSYEGIPNTYWSYFEKMSVKNELIREASRLTLHSGYRSISNAKFLVECALVIYVLMDLRMPHAVIDCNSRHRTLYEFYGFKPIDAEYTFHGVKKLALFLNSVPVHLQAKLHAMSDEFKLTGKIERKYE